jgi:proteasome lid subunit RPN8/RPN11
MIAHAQADLPNECCGLLAGKPATDGTARAERHYPLVSDLDANNPEPHPLRPSPTEYLSTPKSMFAADKDMRALELEILVVYHSHPTSEPVPSKKDRERNYLGEVMHFIIGLNGETPVVRAWWLTSEAHHEAEWEVII